MVFYKACDEIRILLLYLFYCKKQGNSYNGITKVLNIVLTISRGDFSTKPLFLYIMEESIKIIEEMMLGICESDDNIRNLGDSEYFAYYALKLARDNISYKLK